MCDCKLSEPCFGDKDDCAFAAQNRTAEEKPMNKPDDKTPYGYCPKCYAIGINRERRLNGNDKCWKGCVYPSSTALASPPKIMNKPDDMPEIKEAKRILSMTQDMRYSGYSFCSEADQMAGKVIELINSHKIAISDIEARHREEMLGVVDELESIFVNLLIDTTVRKIVTACKSIKSRIEGERK